MLEIELAGRFIAGAGMRGAEFLGLRPALEMRLALPGRVRRIERVIVRFRSLQQIEGHETRQPIEIGFTACPDGLEGFFGAFCDLETVHRDKHQSSPCECWRRLASDELAGALADVLA